MSKTLASIYPLQLGPEYRPFFHPENSFMIPGVEYGQPPALLKIEESFEVVEQLLSKSPVRHAISAEEIANDLLNMWTRGWHGSVPNVAHPGVWICSEDAPTPGEIKIATQVQAAFLNNRILRGNQLWADAKTRSEIDTHMKAAARWMRVKTPWTEDLTAESNTTCPFCTNLIPVGTIVCPKCSQVVDVERFAEMEIRKQRAMENAQGKGNLPSKIPVPTSEQIKALGITK